MTRRGPSVSGDSTRERSTARVPPCSGGSAPSTHDRRGVLAQDPWGKIVRHVDKVDELVGEPHEAVDIGEVGGKPKRSADRPAGRQPDQAHVVVEYRRITELPAEQC